ncbi:MAG: hypothetical protein R6W77_00655 [Trueperaceae bacterium]
MPERTDTPSSGSAEAHQGPSGRYRYEIRIQGHLDDRWVEELPGFSLLRDADGTTRLAGPVVDQAALHGLLRRIRDLGWPLLAVVRLGALPESP